MDYTTIHGKRFKKFIPYPQVEDSIKKVAEEINAAHEHEEVIFLSILNGSFMFTGDLMKHIRFHCQISFLKLQSYQGQESTGNVKQLIGLNEDVNGKTVIILEDIVDTGTTLEHIIRYLQDNCEPAKIKLATLLYKPESYSKPYPVDYFGVKIPNKFVVGYGLDFDGAGRNLKDIYQLA